VAQSIAPQELGALAQNDKSPGATLPFQAGTGLHGGSQEVFRRVGMRGTREIQARGVAPGRAFSFLSLFCALVMSLAVSVAHAQYRTSIQGVVSDPTGAVIPGATLTLTNDGTNEKQVRTSDGNGIYNFNALPPDTFTLVVTKDGFQEKDLVKLQLNPEQANSVNVQLTLGAATQTVTVNASTEPAIDTETADNGRSITSR
jgi:copper(I)-binding protein